MRNHGCYGVKRKLGEDDPALYSTRPSLVVYQVEYVDHV